MNKKLLVGMLAGLLASIGAYASDDLSYSYVEANYVREEIDNGPDGDGFGLSGSVEVGSHVHVFAGFAGVGFDSFLGVVVDTTSWTLGGGYHVDIAQKASFFGEVGYVDVDLDTNFGDVSDDGFSAAVGIRGLVASKIELTGGINYVDLSDAGDDTAVSAGILFNVSDMVSLGAGYLTSDDGDALNVGVRVYFGHRN